MNNFRFKLAQFFQGRTGVDNLARTTMIIALLLTIVTTFTHNPIVYIISLLFYFYTLWRIMSKNYQKRYYENQKFMQLMSPVRIAFLNIKNRIKRGISKVAYDKKQREIYTIFYCPTCKQKLRAPKGRGKIQVTCHSCHTTFIKKV